MERVLLADGRSIQDSRDLILLLNSVGVYHESDIRYLYFLLREALGEQDNLNAARNKADEYELIADEYCQHLTGLCEEVRGVADKLLSGKRGSAYTKEYLGNALLNAVSSYEL